MPLDPQVEKLLQKLSNIGLPPVNMLTPQQARELAAKSQSKPLRPQRIARIENITIPSINGNIKIRIYTPKISTTPLPVLVYFHGGGWVLGDLEAADNICRSLSLGAECIVVSVDYRLAPEHKFPAAIEDAYAATNWVAKNAAKFNGDRHRLVVAGDSSGGNLAAVVALMARDKGEPFLAYQLLIYPVTNYAFDTESYQLYGRGNFGLSKDEMIWFWHHYLVNTADGKNPYASPLLATCDRLPPAYIITAEYDVLRDEAQAYAVKLQAAGVPVLLKQYDGLIHNFVGFTAVLDRGKQALTEIAEQLRILI